MAKRKPKKKVGFIGRLWWRCKLLALLLIVGGGVWYTQQDKATQERAQGHALDAFNWLVERDETNWSALVARRRYEASIVLGDAPGTALTDR